MFKKILLTTLISAIALPGLVSAHGPHELPDAGILPGNPLYVLELLFESVGSFFTFGNIAKAERAFLLAEERLAEADALAEAGKSNRAEKATEKYEKHLKKALERAENIGEDASEEMQHVLVEIAEATAKHQEVLTGLLDKVAEQARDTIKKAIEVSARGFTQSIESVGENEREDVRHDAEENIDHAQEKLKELKENEDHEEDGDEDHDSVGDLGEDMQKIEEDLHKLESALVEQAEEEVMHMVDEQIEKELENISQEIEKELEAVAHEIEEAMKEIESTEQEGYPVETNLDPAHHENE